MGQPITITGTTVEGPIAGFHTDRGITGQDGVSFGAVEHATAANSFPGDLAARLFEADAGVDHVFIASNQVVVRRSSDWDDATLASAGEVIAGFFVFYAGS